MTPRRAAGRQRWLKVLWTLEEAARELGVYVSAPHDAFAVAVGLGLDRSNCRFNQTCTGLAHIVGQLLGAYFRALIEIFSQSVWPRLAIWVNPVQFMFL